MLSLRSAAPVLDPTSPLIAKRLLPPDAFLLPLNNFICCCVLEP